MKTMTSTQIKNHFGDFLEAARREPVILTQHGREVVVAMSMEEAKNLPAFRARAAAQRRAAGPAKRNALLDLIGKWHHASHYKSDEDIINSIRDMRGRGS